MQHATRRVREKVAQGRREQGTVAAHISTGFGVLDRENPILLSILPVLPSDVGLLRVYTAILHYYLPALRADKLITDYFFP